MDSPQFRKRQFISPDESPSTSHPILFLLHPLIADFDWSVSIPYIIQHQKGIRAESDEHQPEELAEGSALWEPHMVRVVFSTRLRKVLTSSQMFTSWAASFSFNVKSRLTFKVFLFLKGKLTSLESTFQHLLVSVRTRQHVSEGLVHSCLVNMYCM